MKQVKTFSLLVQPIFPRNNEFYRLKKHTHTFYNDCDKAKIVHEIIWKKNLLKKFLTKKLSRRDKFSEESLFKNIGFKLHEILKRKICINIPITLV